MDPLTHALVGAGVAALTGDRFSLDNPLHMGAVLGALAPDFDIILQFYGDIPYLTHHRGSSHSVPGVLFSSAVIAFILWLLMGSVHPALIYVWTLLGSVSHIVLDMLNSYGAQVFWPFSRKKYSFNLLVLADPVIIVLFAGVMLWPGIPAIVAKTAFWLAISYVGVRLYMRRSVSRMLWRRYGPGGAARIVVMPAMVSLWNWAFLVETPDEYIVGEVRCFSLSLGVNKVLPKSPKNQLIRKALDSKLGRMFQNFTPYFHTYQCVEEGCNVVRFCDLRYFFRDDFLHHGTVVFDDSHDIVDAVFQPYNRSRKNKVTG